ncbi:integrase core domain-containing protein [Pectinatus cerevisiiphilus]|uniref:integrase core domain-containing protein n=1 Tax=Pectinatus cerevisiiphilus TaxID=86956 RepID=UPI0018C4BFD6|nr:integrase core domain-containing protein [Pectinatus cerevisiiphilus]
MPVHQQGVQGFPQGTQHPPEHGWQEPLGRWADNIKIERWFRTFKYEEAYLTQYRNIREARRAIRNYINVYNFQRCHSAIGNVPPAERYFPALLLNAAMSAA